MSLVKFFRSITCRDENLIASVKMNIEGLSHVGVLVQISKQWGEATLPNEGGALYDGIFGYEKSGQYVLDQLLPKIPGGIAGKFVREIADGEYIDRICEIGRRFDTCMYVDSIDRVFDGLITLIDRDRAIGIIGDV